MLASGTEVIDIVPEPTFKNVETLAARDDIVAPETDNYVTFAVARNRVVEVSAPNVLYRDQRIATFGVLRARVPQVDDNARQGFAIIRDVTTRATVQQIVAGPANQYVIAVITVQLVVAVRSGQRVVARSSSDRWHAIHPNTSGLRTPTLGGQLVGSGHRAREEKREP